MADTPAAPAANPAPALGNPPAPPPPAPSPDPVLRLQAILDAEKAPPQAKAPPAVPGTEPAKDEPPAGPNKQVESEEPEKPAEPVSTETTELPLEQVESIELEVTTKGEDGKDVAEKRTVKELKLGYMRQADYQRKTAEVARQREEVAEKTRQAIESERTQAQQMLQHLQALVVESVAPELQGTDLNKLATDDPFEYVKRRNRLDQITQTLSKIQSAQKELAEKQKAEFDTKRKEALDRARETLQADIPGWNDTLYQQLMKSAENYGYKAEEVAQWMDARAIKLLYAAEKARTQVPAKPSVDKKVVAVPKAMRPGASAEQSQAQQRQASALQQLQKSGRLDDAAAVIAARLR